MQLFKFFKNFWIFTASYFTAIATAMSVFFWAFGGKELIPERFLTVLLLSCIMGIGSAVYRLDNIGSALALCLHAIIYNSGFFIFMWIITDYESNTADRFSLAFIGTLILAVIYVAAMLLIKFTIKANRKTVTKSVNKVNSKNTDLSPKKAKKEDKKPYENQFS